MGFTGRTNAAIRRRSRRPCSACTTSSAKCGRVRQRRACLPPRLADSRIVASRASSVASEPAGDAQVDSDIEARGVVVFAGFAVVDFGGAGKIAQPEPGVDAELLARKDAQAAARHELKTGDRGLEVVTRARAVVEIPDHTAHERLNLVARTDDVVELGPEEQVECTRVRFLIIDFGSIRITPELDQAANDEVRGDAIADLSDH